MATTKTADKTTTETAAKKTTKKAVTKKTTTKRAVKKKTAVKPNKNRSLVIVESPAKAKTIKKYLGRGFEVLASMGHIRDLPKSKLGVDVENDFEPQYINVKSQSKTIKALKEEAKKCGNIYLATDPDREGEAISWHLAQLLGLDVEAKNRVTFNEITKFGVQNGMDNPRGLDMDLINSQQTRRILDRLVGYKLSPFLWKKIKSGLSAGRVQSVAVSLIVEREKEIRAFVSEEYWSIEALLDTGVEESNHKFTAKFYGEDGKKIELKTKEESEEIVAVVSKSQFEVTDIKNATRKKNPAPPFITSTLQQEASRKLGFQSRRTMQAAQELYEGVDVGEYGTMGLITYMRTDSLRISDTAAEEAKNYIVGKYGENYVPSTRRVFKSKGNAQDGHEAIRPTNAAITPEIAKASLTNDQFKIYKLIWQRFIASQMETCLLDTVNATIYADKYMFKASGYTVKFDGFTALYEEGKDEESTDEGALPKLEKEQKLLTQKVTPNQHFTQPPARYTEATLIKTLEENGIGRPSTYSPTITTVIARNYIERDSRQLKPTFLGEVTNELITEYFHKFVEVEFSAKMEEDLDKIEHGSENWKVALRNFYGDFDKALKYAEENMPADKIELPQEISDEICENCGKNMVVKNGRFGKFLACPGYPDCKNTKRIVTQTEGNCPLCSNKMVEQKSKKGKKFFGCSTYPTCNFVTWDTPIKEECPQCSKTMFKKGGREGYIYCADEKCDYRRGLKE